MTNPTPAAVKAAELSNAEATLNGKSGKWRPDEFERPGYSSSLYAFRKYIKHVSEVAAKAMDAISNDEFHAAEDLLHALILPEPVDHVKEAWAAMFNSTSGGSKLEAFQAELAARGLAIVPVKGDE